MAHPHDTLKTPAVEGAPIPAPGASEIPASSSPLESAKETAATAKEKMKEKVGELSDKASQLASDIPQKTDDALTSMGEKIVDIAGKLKEKAPSEGKLAHPASKLVSGLETGGDYLVNHGVTDIASDVTDIIRKYPVQSLWVGIGIGVLLGAALSRR